MSGEFDRFTNRAKQVLAMSQDEAQRLNHSSIGTEHLLLGMARASDGVAARVLVTLGVQLPKVRSAVEFIIGQGEGSVEGQPALTPRARKVLALAIDEARRNDHTFITTGHLLLGLVREGEGIAAGVLEALGVRPERVRKETLSVLGQWADPQLEMHVQAETSPPPNVPKEGSDDHDMALLTVALRLARKREDQEAIARIRAALESAELRRIVGKRVRAREKLIDAERRRIELMTNIIIMEREIEEYDRQIARIRAEHARGSDDEPPATGMGARVRR